MAQQVERYQIQLREEQERMSILKDELQQVSDAKVLQNPKFPPEKDIISGGKGQTF